MKTVISVVMLSIFTFASVSFAQAPEGFKEMRKQKKAEFKEAREAPTLADLFGSFRYPPKTPLQILGKHKQKSQEHFLK